MFTSILTGHLLGPILAMAVTALVPVIAASLFQWFRKMGLDIEQRHRDALQSALHNAALVAIEKATGHKVADKASPKPSDRSDVIPNVGAAIDYVEKSVPDALAKFKVNTDKLRDLLQPHITNALAKNV